MATKKRKRFSISVNADLHERIKQYCRANGVSMSKLVDDATAAATAPTEDK